ncbi:MULTISPECIES: DUF2059 domain-containing protein [unclassified Roseovarius]|uniref:DUF2059 domain-containing protein n=1 Tax=unclassified Roseovarius TaxID=2614913 RepID=UPI00273E1D8E|nr:MULTISPECIES: DUF2059 domain-containing protein [unclassified Roseovarius]
MTFTFRQFHRPFLLGATLLCMMAFSIAPASAADRARLETFLEVTGFDVALESIALSAKDAPSMLGMAADDFGADWSHTADEVFETDGMRETALDILSHTLDDALLTHAVDFYASDLGQRLVEIENLAHMDEDNERRMAEGTKIVEEGGERLEYLQRMNDAIDSAGTAVKGLHEIQFRFLMAASNAGVLENEIDADALRALLKESEEELREDLKASGLVSAAYTYRDMSDDDLLAYAEALEHPDMKQVYVLMNAVQYEIMANRFEVLADRLADLSPGLEL